MQIPECLLKSDSQFHAVACREYTLPKEEETSQPKGWIQGEHRDLSLLEVATN